MRKMELLYAFDRIHTDKSIGFNPVATKLDIQLGRWSSMFKMVLYGLSKSKTC